MFEHMTVPHIILTTLGVFVIVVVLFALSRPLRGYWRRRKAKFASQVPLTAAEVDSLFKPSQDIVYRALYFLGQLAMLSIGVAMAAWGLDLPPDVRIPLVWTGLAGVPVMFLSLGLVYITRTEIIYHVGRLTFPVLFHPGAQPSSGLAKRYTSLEAFNPGSWQARGWVMIAFGLFISLKIFAMVVKYGGLSG